MKIRNALMAGVAAIALAGLSVPASAADGAIDWSGGYIGAHAGYGDASLDGEWCPSECELPFSAFDLNGGLGGLQAGFNVQFDSFVVGGEADISFTNWSDTAYNCGGPCTSSANASVDFLASVRARAGMAFDRALIYATGGIAFVDGEFQGSCSEFCGKASLNDIGWVLGGGVEYAVADHVSVRAEGMYYLFNGTESLEDWAEFSDGDKVGIDDAWVLRIGINFRF